MIFKKRIKEAPIEDIKMDYLMHKKSVLMT